MKSNNDSDKIPQLCICPPLQVNPLCAYAPFHNKDEEKIVQIAGDEYLTSYGRVLWRVGGEQPHLRDVTPDLKSIKPQV